MSDNNMKCNFEIENKNEKEEPLANNKKNKFSIKYRLLKITAKIIGYIILPIVLIVLFIILIFYILSPKNNEFLVKYYINNIENEIKLFDDSNNITKSIKLMIINDKKIKPTSYYKFQNEGTYLMKIEVKKSFTLLSSLFKDCKNLEEIDFSNFDFEKINNISYLFSGCSSLKNISWPKSFKKNNISDISYLFYNCKSLTSKSLPDFETSSLIQMRYAFSNCSFYDVKLSNYITSNVIDMEGLFSFSLLYTVDLSNFNTSQLKSMSKIFYRCKNLYSINLQNFNTSNLVSYQDSFKNISSEGTLKINSSIFNKSILKELPRSWKIIDVNK
jgi:surface protein